MTHSIFSKKSLQRFSLFAVLAMFIVSMLTQNVSAIDKNFFAGNDIEFYDPTCAYTGGTSDGSLFGKNNEEKIWNFLRGRGLTENQTAGVMGNLRQESGPNYDPAAEEGNGIGYGIAQWSFGRRTALENAAKKKGVAVSDLAFQLDFLYQESNSRRVTAKGFGNAGNEWDTLKIQQTMQRALVFWHDNFEVSADSPESVIRNRGGFAQAVLDKYAGKPIPGGVGTSGGGAEKSVIFLDPGHGGAVAPYTDTTGLVDFDTARSPEREDTLEVANRVKTALEQAGYKVELSRTVNTASVSSRERVTAAKDAKADLAVSIHTTPGNINDVWPQRVDAYRQFNEFTKVVFNNADTAKISEASASNIAAARTTTEGHTVGTDPGNVHQADEFNLAALDTKSKTPKGNIPLVSLWSTDVPWVYNEISQDKGASLSEARKAAYAKGLITGIKQSVPPNKGIDECGSAAFTGGDLSKTVLAYAWPQYHKKPYVQKRPAYAAAVSQAKKDGIYVGDSCYGGGVDCGGFVTLLLINSGFEPKYNYEGKLSKGASNTSLGQEPWAKANWQSLGSGSSINVADLKPGDVAFEPGHTFVYVGKIDGFDSTIASASQCGRAPMAGSENPTGSGVRWYRKKG